jgi:UDP-2-acetamido-3-amino-2,3-dideoxy-glucuronate N-acetyltransferase
MNIGFIDPTAWISDSTTIGKNVQVGPFCMISNGVIIGDNCKIGARVSVPENVILEDLTYIGDNVVFINSKVPRSFIRNEPAKETILKYGSSIGSNSTIQCGVTIGKFSFVDHGSFIIKNISDNKFVSGNPQEEKYTICKCGKDLNLVNNVCNDCKSLFRYNSFYEDYIVEDL